MANEKKLEDYLHLYLGCEVQFVFETRSEYPHLKHDLRIGQMVGIKKNGYAKRVEIIMDNGTFHDVAFEEAKLVLRPLSDIKEEEVLKMCSIVSPTIFGDFRYNKWKVAIEREWDSAQKNYTVVREGDSHSFEVDCIDGDIFLWDEHQYIDAPYMNFNYKFEYLKKGFDIFGLIEAGLAVDKTTLTPNQ